MKFAPLNKLPRHDSIVHGQAFSLSLHLNQIPKQEVINEKLIGFIIRSEFGGKS
jgi:hypothetical protein